MSASKLHKPSAWQVENSHCNNPHGINERQPMTVPERAPGPVGNDSAVPNRLVEGQCHQDGHDVKHVEVQDIVKQRYPAEYQQNPSQPLLRSYPVKQPKQDECRTQCHEQVVERRRILERVEE